MDIASQGAQSMMMVEQAVADQNNDEMAEDRIQLRLLQQELSN